MAPHIAVSLRLTVARLLFFIGSSASSAGGAALNSHGRKAVGRSKKSMRSAEGATFRVIADLNAGPSGLIPYTTRYHGLAAVAIQCRAFGARPTLHFVNFCSCKFV